MLTSARTSFAQGALVGHSLSHDNKVWAYYLDAQSLTSAEDVPIKLT